MKTSLFAPLLVLVLSFQSIADMGAAEKKALEETQRVLLSPSLRLEAAEGPGKEALAQVGKIAGSVENQQLIFELAADILATMAQEANGDPDKMMAVIDKFSRDPASLEGKLTASQKQKLKMIAQKIEAKGKTP